MVGTMSSFLHIWPVILLISSANCETKTTELINKCTTDNDHSISAWDWEVRLRDKKLKDASYFINICHGATNCDAGTSVCKKDGKKLNMNYGSSVTVGAKLTTSSYPNGFSITFTGKDKAKSHCNNTKLQTKIIFICHNILGSPELVDDNGCMVIIEFFTKEACPKTNKNIKIPEIPCVLYNVDKEMIDLTPLIKIEGGHHVSADRHNVDIYINVCRDITFTPKIPAFACSDKDKKTSSACRADIKQPIGRITKDTKLYYDNKKINLVYNYTLTKPAKDCSHVTTKITFLCQTKITNGEAGPVLITNVTASKMSCAYEILWRTGHACPNNDVTTEKCQFSNDEVSFDLTKLEKQRQESYQVLNNGYEYRIKVCSNRQACGSDVEGKHTAVCQINKVKDKVTAYSCGDADHRTLRYADNVLTMVYKQGSPCRNGVQRRTIITFHCDATIDVGKPEFVDEKHCYYYFRWHTRHVCPSRLAGSCSVISSKKDTYDLSILTKVNSTWLAVNNRQDAIGYTYYINVCANLAHLSLKYPECRGSAACEVPPPPGKPRGIGMYKSTPNFTKDSGLSLTYTGGKCARGDKNIKTFIKFICKPKNLESPPELESRTWDGCDYVFTWSTAAACSLKVISGEDSCVLEDTVTGNVYDLSPLGKPDHFTVSSSGQTFYIKMCSKKGLDTSKFCGKKGDTDPTGICQKTTTGDYYVAGKMNDKLYYYDGVLKIKFKHGKRCTRKHKPERESHITLFCDESAGLGNPVFVGEPEYCVYSFVWNTKHACPLKTIECFTVGEDGTEYDLSPLVKTEDNWKVVKNGKTFFINICRVLHRTKETAGCPVRSSVCMNNGTDIVSIGEIEDGSGGSLKLDSGSHFPYLEYTSGKYRTIISFICDQTGGPGSPTLLSNVTRPDYGIYKFEWITKEACDIKPRGAESGCGDPDSGISLLKTSDKKGYSITVPSRGKINFDICQNITCGKDKTPSTACFIPSKGEEFSIGRSPQSSVEHGENLITLIYPGGKWNSTASWGKYYKTKINFVCSPDILKGHQVFIAQEKNVFIIEFKTYVACKAPAIQCEVQSGKNKYNLKPLAIVDGNWMTADVRQHLKYYINVCQEYYAGVSDLKCSGRGGIGGCQVDTDNKKAHNIGYFKKAPVVSSTGDVTLRYTGGELCHNKKFQRKTRINFFCSDVHGSPVFMIETNDCEYVFNWKTPSACPVLEHDEIKQSCAVYDETYSVYYDLSSLNQFTEIPEIEKGVVYTGGFCGADKCGKGFSSCFVKGESITKRFKFMSMKYYDNKMIIIHTNETNTITHEISCNKEGKLLAFVSKSKSSHNYHIDWSSKLVCPPVVGEECSLTNGQNFYDLSVLAKENWNWLGKNAVEDFGFKDYEFYFSVCKPLKRIPGLENRGFRAAMKDNNGNFISLGTMIERLRVYNGFLTMTYGHADIPSRCKNGTTTIQFVCDDVIPEGVGVGPVVDGFDETQCKFHVTWLTRAACSVRSLDKAESPRPCTAVHPATMKSIDLSPLKKSGGYTVYDQDSKNPYLLNVCGAVAPDCPKSSSICRKNDKTSVGSVSTKLVYRQGFLYLHYVNGEKCDGHPGRKAETLISFMCDSSAGKGTPTLERDDDCNHFVTWKTSLACEAEVDCVAHSATNFYDLSPLIKNDDNYELQHNGTKYLINVCRSLVSNSNCSSNAAVCALPNEHKAAKDLGYVRTAPKIVQDKENEAVVRLIYENKGSCQNTTIDFVCDPHDRVDKAIIVDADECSVTITWWTSLVCDKKTVTMNDCTFNDTEQQFCFDLNRLAQSHPKNVPIPGRGNAHFHVCGDASKDCAQGDNKSKSKSGEVCLMVDKKLREALSRKSISYDGSKVEISYDDEVFLLLYCGRDNNWNRPQYIGEVKDSKKSKYYFNMITAEVCPPRKLLCEVKHGGKTYSLAGLREKTYEVNGNGGDKYWVSICSHVPFSAKPKICSSRATAIRATTKTPGEPQVIGVDTQHSITYQENKIHLEYSSDQKVEKCTTKDKKPKVLHKFTCKSVMLPPKFDGFKKSTCTFTFKWETSEACAEKREPMRQIGQDWIFYDEKSTNCNLDLTILKNAVSKFTKPKKCELSKTVKLYAEEENYELVVDCFVKSKKMTVDVIISCTYGNESEPILNAESNTYISLRWETALVCDTTRSSSCSNSVSRPGAKSAIAVIGTLAGIGLLAAIVFFACKPEKRERVGLWMRWHVRKYICCKPSYQASYRYKKVNTDEVDGDAGFIIEECGAGAGSLFSDSEDDDNHNSDDKDDDDDDLLPLDDDLLNLD